MSGMGVVLAWALTFGKWAVIVTQLIVMVAFLWRFALDRQLTNLRKEIDQQKAIIASYSQVEGSFTMMQKRVAFASAAYQQQAKLAKTIEILQAVTPQDVWYDRLSVTNKSVNLTAYSSSLPGFSLFLAALQRRPEFTSVSVGSIEDGGTKGAQLRFDMTLGMREGGK